MSRTTWSLHWLLCTVYTDVILILCHFRRDSNTDLMEPLIAATVTLHPVDLQEIRAATHHTLPRQTDRHGFYEENTFY